MNSGQMPATVPPKISFIRYNYKSIVEIPTILLGAPQLCPLPVVPECHRSLLYRPPISGFTSAKNLENVVPPVHFLQLNTQEFCTAFHNSAPFFSLRFASVLAKGAHNGHEKIHFFPASLSSAF